MNGRQIAFVLGIVVWLSLAACNNRQQKKFVGREVELTSELWQHDVCDTLRLGIIHQGEVVEQRLQIRNNTNQKVVILDYDTTCGCTSLDFMRGAIDPNGTLPVTCRFDSAGEYGWKLNVVSLRLAGTESRVRLLVECEIK